MARHNKLRDGVADLAGKFFTPTQVRDDPLIFAGCIVKRKMENLSTPKTIPSTKKLESLEQKDHLLIRDLWQNGKKSVHRMRFMNTEAKYHS